MSLPNELDTKIQKSLDNLIDELQLLSEKVEHRNKINEQHVAATWDGRSEGKYLSGPIPVLPENEFYTIRNRFQAILHMLDQNNPYIKNIIDEIVDLDIYNIKKFSGIVKGFQITYQDGFLDHISAQIEANIAADYMGQAGQLLGEGIPGQYDHVPAAVLSGAVLEDALRQLCEKQSPPIDVLKSNGSKKTLDPLIADLQRSKVFNSARGDQLRSWAKIRNHAAHGEFDQFDRAQVEAMIIGIKGYIADYL